MPKTRERNPTEASRLDRFQALVPTLQGQKRKAAQYMLDHPKEVGVLSLRQLANRARVSPATFIQMANDAEFDGYNDLKAIFQLEHLGIDDYFSSGAARLAKPGAKDSGGSSLLAQIARDDIKGIEAVTTNEMTRAIQVAARLVVKARRVNVIGMRACHGVAHYLTYLLQLLREDVRLLSHGDATLPDHLHELDARDVLVAFGFYPYVQQTVDAVAAADRLGVPVVAITDSDTSPLVRAGTTQLRFGTASPWIFASVTPSIVVCQALAAQVLTLGGQETLDRIKSREQWLAQTKTFKS